MHKQVTLSHPWWWWTRMTHITSIRTTSRTRDHPVWTCETSNQVLDGNMESKQVRARTCVRNVGKVPNRRTNAPEERRWELAPRGRKEKKKKGRETLDERRKNKRRCNTRAPPTTHERRTKRVGTRTRCRCDLQEREPCLSEELFIDQGNE